MNDNYGNKGRKWKGWTGAGKSAKASGTAREKVQREPEVSRTRSQTDRHPMKRGNCKQY